MEDVMICQLMSIVAAGQVDQVRFNQAEITLYWRCKLSPINNHLHLQTGKQYYLTTYKQIRNSSSLFRENQRRNKHSMCYFNQSQELVYEHFFIFWTASHAHSV